MRIPSRNGLRDFGFVSAHVSYFLPYMEAMPATLSSAKRVC